MPKTKLPADNIAEISLIGTGGGYGESSVIHLGWQKWVIVDSCKNPESHDCLPLEYLKEIGVDLGNVELILCTHWHDDHILGLAQLLENCPNARFCFARANDRQKFLNYINLDFEKTLYKDTVSTKEFIACLFELEKSKRPVVRAIMDRIITTVYDPNNKAILSQVISLSPSDQTCHNFDTEISTLITEFGAPQKKVVISNPNCKSIVVYLKLGVHRALLGSDLEVSKNKLEGWVNILDNSQSIDGKSTLFKIPHHGSVNGYESRVWDELLEKNPVSTLTSWNRNRKLPQSKMLHHYFSHSARLYMTTGHSGTKAKRRDTSMERDINKFKKSLREVRFKRGIVRARIDIGDIKAVWDVELIENAVHVQF